MRSFEIVLDRKIVNVEVLKEEYSGEITEYKLMDYLDRLMYSQDSYVKNYILDTLFIDVYKEEDITKLRFKNDLTKLTYLEATIKEREGVYCKWM